MKSAAQYKGVIMCIHVQYMSGNALSKVTPALAQDGTFSDTTCGLTAK